MLAHAFLVVVAVTERLCRPPPSGLIALTCNEVQHLFAALAARPRWTGSRPTWSGNCGALPRRPERSAE
jgi:hypothetical protein